MVYVSEPPPSQGSKFNPSDPPPSYSVAVAYTVEDNCNKVTSRKKSVRREAPPNVYELTWTSPGLEKPLKEYIPYEHRNVKHATSFSETLFHLLKASLGTGVLAMPSAFSNAGYAVGLIGTLFIGFVCTYSIHSLISSEYELCRRRKKPSMTYAEILETSWLEGPPFFKKLAPYADFVANMFILMYELGSCCIYFVFVAANVKAVADDYFSSLDVRLYMLILLPAFILINLVRNLKVLAPFSTVANLITVVSFGIIAYYVFSDIPPLSDRVAVAPVSQFPLYFGTVLFAMEAIGVVMTLENEMGEPEKFRTMFGVLNCAMLPITVLYTVVGLFGYLKYGSESKGSITLNLPNDQLLAQAAKLMLALAIYVTHGLACFVSFDIIWNQKLKKRVSNNTLFWEYMTRILLVLLTFVFAAAIPNLELFISLIGAFCLSTMGLSFPAMIQLLTFWDYYRGFGKLLFFLKNLIIIIIAVFGFVVGVSTSLIGIYHMFADPQNTPP